MKRYWNDDRYKYLSKKCRDEMEKAFDFLDSIDLRPFIEKGIEAHQPVIEIAKEIEDAYENDFDEPFKCIDTDDFTSYLKEQYGIKSYEVTETFLYF